MHGKKERERDYFDMQYKYTLLIHDAMYYKASQTKLRHNKILNSLFEQIMILELGTLCRKWFGALKEGLWGSFFYRVKEEATQRRCVIGYKVALFVLFHQKVSSYITVSLLAAFGWLSLCSVFQNRQLQEIAHFTYVCKSSKVGVTRPGRLCLLGASAGLVPILIYVNRWETQVCAFSFSLTKCEIYFLTCWGCDYCVQKYNMLSWQPASQI